jgi:hypothetical protein
VQDGSVAHIWASDKVSPFGIVVLDACGSTGSQWTAQSGGAGHMAFENDIAKGTKCWLLNVVGDSPDVEACEVGVWSFGTTCPTTPTLNSNFDFDASTSQIKVIASDRVAKTCPDANNCCLQATPCVSPCSLPLGWGWAFLLAVSLLSALYVGGGMLHSTKVQGKAFSDGGIVPLLPHGEFWRAAWGLCADGTVFARAELAKRRGGGGYEAVPEAGGSAAATADAKTTSRAAGGSGDQAAAAAAKAKSGAGQESEAGADDDDDEEEDELVE